MSTLHRFSRMELLAGNEGMKRLAAASVAVFGIGGVGSYAAEALARAGVGRLVLVDFDDICLTNINRQIHALDSQLGRSKAEAMGVKTVSVDPRHRSICRRRASCPEQQHRLLHQHRRRRTV